MSLWSTAGVEQLFLAAEIRSEQNFFNESAQYEGDNILPHALFYWNKHNSPTPPLHFLQKHKVYVCVCIEGGSGSARKTNKDTRSSHTPVFGCMPSSSPQTAAHAFRTHTDTL